MLQETKKSTTPLDPMTRVNFILQHGGIGDYICWLSAIRWVSQTFHYAQYHVFFPDYFDGIPQNAFRDQKNIVPRHFSTSIPADDVWPTMIPDPYKSPINAGGTHLVNCGFIFFANRAEPPTPEDGQYLQLDLSDVQDLTPPDLGPTAVMTPGHTNPTRAMPAKVFNAIKDHLLSRGVTPIFLGKAVMAPEHKSSVASDYDLSGGIDLTEKTNLLQAAKIIESSKLIVGLDNGLLHLAAMTPTPIVFGHNVIEPEFRIPRRPKGPIFNVYPLSTLDCRYCQSRMRFIYRPANADRRCMAQPSDPIPRCLSEMEAAPYIDAVEDALNG